MTILVLALRKFNQPVRAHAASNPTPRINQKREGGAPGPTHAGAGPVSEKKGEQIACFYKVKERTIANPGTKWKCRFS